MRLIDKRILAHFDFIHILLIIPIVLVSHILISEANDTLATKQLIYIGAGVLGYIVFFLLPIKKLEWLIPTIYWISIVLLISVDLFGVVKLGAQRWLEIPFINFTIQPSEIFKPSFILMLAYIIKQNPPPETGYNLKQFLLIASLIILPFLLIAKEPDLGTALIVFLTGFAVLFVVGVNKKIWISLAILTAIASPLLYQNLHDYQKKRISDFLSEEPSYHVKQSMIAIGNGGMSGKSKDEATQTHFKFLPIATSDFIFAYLIERHGFVGASFLMGIYALLILYILRLNVKFKGDYFLQVIATSIAALIFIYTTVNVSMTIGFAPVVGVPLPLFSYGGSSFLTFMCLFGILQNLITFRFSWEK